MLREMLAQIALPLQRGDIIAPAVKRLNIQFINSIP